MLLDLLILLVCVTGQAPTDCDSLTSQADCAAAGSCAWCTENGAMGQCKSPIEARSLPPMVWKCQMPGYEANSTASMKQLASSANSSAALCTSDMQRLEATAKAYASGRRPLGHCYAKVADYIDASGYGGIKKGGFDAAIPPAYYAYAHDFADYLNKDGNAARLSLAKLDCTNPYKAPEGSIVVVRAGTPGTADPKAGDIVVKGGGDHFYNDGEMGYGGSSNFPPGNTFVLGVYAPTKCSGSSPAPGPSPGPSSDCKACVNGGGGTACESKCTSCGSACESCIKGGGGKACSQKCC